jgi:hypothetical protein
VRKAGEGGAAPPPPPPPPLLAAAPAWPFSAPRGESRPPSTMSTQKPDES